MNELISILIPCYNGEKTIDRLLNSILAQTYRPLELIVVNDGSTDNSCKHIEAFRERFEADSIQLVNHYQENTGLGGAIDTALKLFHGEYFCLADADDFLAESSIARRVQYLKGHPDVSLVSSDAYTVPDNDVLRPTGKCADSLPHIHEENQFWHLLRGNSLFCAGCHMYRTADFEKVNPTRSIYPARRGQNWQLLLPMYYQFKRAFLDEPLYYYVVSPNSMSRDYSVEQKLFRCDEHEDIILQTLDSFEMKEEDREKAIKMTRVQYAARRLSLASKAGRTDLAKEQYSVLKQQRAVTARRFIYYVCAKHKALRKLFYR